MKYEFNDEIKLPKSVIDRKEREQAMAALEKGVSDAVSEIEKPLLKIVDNLSKDSKNHRQFETDVSKVVSDLTSHVKSQDKKVETLIEKSGRSTVEIIDIIRAQYEDLKEQYKKEKVVTVDNLGDIIIPPNPKVQKVEFKDKQEVYGNVNADVEFPKVQIVKLKDKIKPPVINVTEKVIEFPEVQKVELKDKIKPPIVKVQQNKVVFPDVQKIKFDKIPTIKVKNPNTEVKVTNLKDIKLKVPSKFQIENLPVANGHKPSVKKANPEFYIPVRITNGKLFNDSIGGGGVVRVGGKSSLPQQWINTSGTVGTSSVRVLGANSMRKLAVITNDSDTAIYLGFGQHAVSHSGIRLNSNGGFYEVGKTNHFTGNIFAISTSDNKNVCILEVSSKV